MFDPHLPAAANIARRNMRSGPSRPFIPKVEQRSSSPLPEEEDTGEMHDDDDIVGDVSLNTEISNAIAKGGSGRIVIRRDTETTPAWARLLFGVVAVTLAAITGSFKVNSASIGYCSPGTHTNAILAERQVARKAAQECTERLARQSDVKQSRNSCTPLPLVPLPEPMSCTPCPAHGYCTPHTVTCEQSFVLRQHPLSYVPFLPEILNGMPGFGPVALPPSCVEDEERRRNIGRLGVGLENYLALTRGQRLCMGVTGSPGDGGEAAQWGLDINQVHDHLKKATVVQVSILTLVIIQSAERCCRNRLSRRMHSRASLTMP